MGNKVSQTVSKYVKVQKMLRTACQNIAKMISDI